MAGIERQRHFGEISPEWQSIVQVPQERKNPLLEIDSACPTAFERTQALWQRYSQFVPKDYDFLSPTGEIKFQGGSMFLSERTQELERFPKIKDLEYPEELAPLFEEIIKRNKKKENMRFPWRDSFAAILHIYGRFPVSDERDILGFNNVADIFDEWAPDFFEKWRARVPKVIGSLAQVYTENGDYFGFEFSKRGELISFQSIQDQPAKKDYKIVNGRVHDLPTLSTQAAFRNGKLYSLYQEVPNGTLFPDPKGPIDSIWPQWVKQGVDEYDEGDGGRAKYYGEDGVPAIEEGWYWYLGRIRHKKLVFSPRTKEYVHQTEKQARENLERNRIFIYYKIPQGFHFYRTGNGFLSETGYSVRSKYRRKRDTFIPKKPSNPDSYHVLSDDQTAQLLSSWNPEMNSRQPLLTPQERMSQYNKN